MKKLKLIASYVRLITCLLLHRNFGKIALLCLHVISSLKIVQNLCPNLQKPSLPPKIPGDVLDCFTVFE